MNHPLVSVLILTWNRKEYINHCIDGVLKQSYSNIEIIIADNNSNYKISDHILKEYKPLVRIISFERNYGCPQGRNLGVKNCKGDFVFFVDDDGYLHKDAISNSIAIQLETNAAVIAGVVEQIVWKHPDDIPNREVDIAIGQYREKSIFSGGICLIKRTIFEDIGGYPSDFLYGSEEVHMSLQLLEMGMKIIQSKDVVLFHGPLGDQISKDMKNLSNWNNKLCVALNLYPLPIKLTFLIYFIFAYPIYSLKISNKCFALFIFYFPFTIIRSLMYFRITGISYKTYLNYKRLLK